MRRLADLTFSINKVKVEQKFVLSQFMFQFYKPVIFLCSICIVAVLGQAWSWGLVIEIAKVISPGPGS
jgi:hypothetical protein